MTRLNGKPNPPSDDVIKDVVKKKRTRPDKTEFLTPHCEPGEISTMLSQAVTIMNWPKVDTNDSDQVEQRIAQYLDYCIQYDIKPDMSGMGLALGTNRTTLWRWENGVESNKPQAVRNSIKRGREIIEYLLVQMMNNGKINPIPAIFLLKNNFSYRDQTDIVVTPNNPLDSADPESTRKKYLDAIPETEADGTVE